MVSLTLEALALDKVWYEGTLRIILQLLLRSVPASTNCLKHVVRRPEARLHAASRRRSSSRYVRQTVPRERQGLDDEKEHRQTEALPVASSDQSHDHRPEVHARRHEPGALEHVLQLIHEPNQEPRGTQRKNVAHRVQDGELGGLHPHERREEGAEQTRRDTNCEPVQALHPRQLAAVVKPKLVHQLWLLRRGRLKAHHQLHPIHRGLRHRATNPVGSLVSANEYSSQFDTLRGKNQPFEIVKVSQGKQAVEGVRGPQPDSGSGVSNARPNRSFLSW